jgi:hypothetical protein
MQIKEINVSRSVCFNIGQQYSNEVLVIHFKGLPDLPNKYIYVKKDNYEKEVPLVGDLYVVSRPLTTYSGEVKAQIIARDPGSTPIALTPNFKMMITPSNYSGIGEDENYPDDPNIKNYYVKIDGKIQSMDELIALVQSKLDNGEFVGAQGPKGEKGEPGDVTEEYRNLASQIAQNASDAQTSATNAQTSASNAQKALDDTKDFVNQTKSELNQIKTDTNALKEEANTSAVNAKASEDKAKEYSDNLKESTDAISQNTKAISELADKKITKFYASNQGETHITDSDNGKIQDMMIYGKSSQDGTPSVENPVEIKSVVNPTVKITNEDGLKVQSVTLNNITLSAIPVSSGGNVTMGGQQYVADYIDVEKGKLYRKVKRIDLKDVDVIAFGIGFHANGNGYLSLSIKETSEGIAIKDIPPMSNNYIGSIWTDKSGYVYIPSARSIIFVDKRFTDKETAIGLTKDTYIIYVLQTPAEEDLTSEQIQALKELATYYHVTNISVNSEQLGGYTVFNYPISMANGWDYVKQQLNDNRDYIYDMDVQSAEAYVNSEYAVALTELEV